MNKYIKKDPILHKLIEDGYINYVESPCKKLYLLNYTNRCIYEKKWNKHTLGARGSVYEIETGNRVAKSFSKFFNHGELAVSKQRNLLKQTDILVTYKYDGSCGILFYYNGEWRLNTRGSFTSDQAVKGREMLSKYDIKRLDVSNTYIVEIIYPENRIILDYGDREDLILLAAFETKSGREISREVLEATSPFPITEVQGFTSIQDLIADTEQMDASDEGFVVKYKNGERVKYKSKEYLRVARIMSGMSKLNMWRNMTRGKVNPEFLEGVPEEFRPELDKMVNDLQSEYVLKAHDVWDDYMYAAKCIGYEGEDPEDYCKALGLLLKEEKLDHSSCMFHCLKFNQEAIDKYVYKCIRPIGV